MSDRPTILEATGVHKTYRLGRVKVPVLHGVDISVGAGEWVAVLGASGSGKSTLLHILGGLDRPTKPEKTGACSACDYSMRGSEDGEPCPECGRPFEGARRATIEFDERDIAGAGGRELDLYKARDVGFVFQFYHLLPELTVLENVVVGAMIRHGALGYASNRGAVRERARGLLADFGLSHRLGHRPVELSGGERQRVALARALINQPRVLLADEPTGNLDRSTGDQILDVLADLRERLGLTMVMVTHDEEVAARADRVIRLEDGKVIVPGSREPA